MTLPRLSAFLCCVAFATAGYTSAEPWTQDKLSESYKSLHAADGAVTCAVEQARVIILFDREGKAAALIAESDNKGVRRLARQIELGETQEAGSGSCIILLRESESSEPRKRLLNNTPLQAIAFLIGQNYYHPAELTEDGRVLWATGKRRSVDVLIPVLGTEPIRTVELKTDIELTDFAANVVARKLGYPQDNSAEATKSALAGNLRADRVHYYSKAHEAAVAAVGKRFFFIEGGRSVLREAAQENKPLPFPTIFPTPEKPAAEPNNATPAEQPAPEKELTPKEALKAYIDRLRKL